MSVLVGWGKIILLGEHAVVYGYPALAAALDRGVTITPIPTPAGGPLRLDVPSWSVAVALVPGAAESPTGLPRSIGRGTSEPLPGEEHPVGRALSAIADTLGVGRPALSLVGDAQIPPGAGLGSSAAMAVAIARALLVHAKRPQDSSVITNAAGASEAVLHGRQSGVDVALATAGGVGVFRRSSGLRRITIPPLRVLVGPSGVPRSTAEMVDRVAQATSAASDDARLAELGALTDTGTAALLARDYAGLGAAMNRAHHVLSGLGVSTEQLDSLCVAARVTGAYGAKLTGAGGGGAVIAIAPRDRENAILAEWRHAGISGFVTTIGQ